MERHVQEEQFNELGNTIEEAIDQTSLTTVLGLIVRICEEKAEHIETNWQDRGLARLWGRIGVRIGKVDTGGL